jgi:hypothetical protein
MTTTPVTKPPRPAPGPEIAARAYVWYRVKQSAMAILLIGWGLWSVYDGYYKWPADNQKIAQLKKEIESLPKEDQKRTEKEIELRKQKEHTALDIKFNQVLGWALPPIGLFLLIRAFYVSRGAYRLRDNTLLVPGHPPVPLDAVKSIDKGKWDRKGIAYLNYELLNGKKGKLTIDDYIYEREPTDDIMKRVEEYTGMGTPQAAEPAEPAANA